MVFPISRRQFIAGSSTSILVSGNLSGFAVAKTNTRSVLVPKKSYNICRWTPTNPRNDHQMIFRLKKGRLLFVWSEYYADSPSHIQNSPSSKGKFFDVKPCRISARISSDNGASWQPKFTLMKNQWKNNVKHPNLIRTKSGEVLFFCVGWDSMAQRNVFLRRSNDDCETWSEIQQISKSGFHGNNHGRAITLKSNRILLPTQGVIGGKPYKGSESQFESWVYYSDDDFKTWKKSTTMFVPGRGAEEPCIVELKNGRLLCFLRNTLGYIHKAYSDDQGQTWTKPVPTILTSPDVESLIVRIPETGDILAIWNNNKSFTGFPRTPLSMAISKDEGETWILTKDIDRRSNFDLAYPFVWFDQQDVWISYYSRSRLWGHGSNNITMRIYNLEELYKT